MQERLRKLEDKLSQGQDAVARANTTLSAESSRSVKAWHDHALVAFVSQSNAMHGDIGVSEQHNAWWHWCHRTIQCMVALVSQNNTMHGGIGVREQCNAW